MTTNRIPRRRAWDVAALLAAAALAATTVAPRAGAQLAYDRTTFLHGIGSSDTIWKKTYPELGGQTSPDYLRRQVYLKAVGTPYLNEGAPEAKDQTAGLRYAGQRNNLTRFLTDTGGQHVLIAHSLGSLVARGAFAADGVGAQRVTGIVTIAAPHQGAWIADADSAARARDYVKELRYRLGRAERNIKLYLGTLFGVGATLFAIEDLITALDLKSSGGLPSGEVDALPLLAALPDLGPNAEAVRTLNAYRGDAGIPRANIRGSIPIGHALLRLAAASGQSSFEELKSRKDKALSLMRKCRNLGNWTFNATDPGNRCQRAAAMLGALDARWAAYTNGTEYGLKSTFPLQYGQVPRRVPFDGVVPNERSNYPTSNGLAYDFTVLGASHQDIYKGQDGLNAVAEGMIRMRMERATTVTATVTGSSEFGSSQTLTWRAAASGGDGAYAYQWSYRPSGSATWYAFGGTGATASRGVSASTPSFTVRIAVTSQSQTTTAQMPVVNSNGTGGCVPQPPAIACAQ